MNIVIVVNDLAKENPRYTTPFVGFEAWKRGHKVFFTDVAKFLHLPNGRMGAHVCGPKKKTFKTSDDFISHLQSDECNQEILTSDDMDILFLRNDPTADFGERSWAQHAGIIFGKIAVRDGVIVLNNPDTLALALIDKMYFEHFPEIVKPESIISRDPDDIKRFYNEHNKKIILKPLQGSGGKDVFLIGEKDSNLNQVIEAISRFGYVIAQAYLPEATKGDVRVIMMNGRILEKNGKVAAIRRVNKTDDFRSNIHAGGQSVKVTVTDKMRKIAEVVGPKLKQDGMFLAGLDMVGDKLMEVNVLSPGAIINAAALQEQDYIGMVIDSMENKVYYRSLYGKQLSNLELNVLD